MGIMTEKEIKEVLSRGVSEFIDPQGKFKEKLLKKARGEYQGEIIIKFGVDPTRPDIHLGHATIFRKLKEFQNLGCKVIFLVGDYTAQIGDPTGKSKTRPEINMEQLAQNVQSFLDQIHLLINVGDKKLYNWVANSVWYFSATDYKGVNMLEKAKNWEANRQRELEIFKVQALPTVTLWNLMTTLRKVTHARLIERDMF